MKFKINIFFISLAFGFINFAYADYHLSFPCGPLNCVTINSSGDAYPDTLSTSRTGSGGVLFFELGRGVDKAVLKFRKCPFGVKRDENGGCHIKIKQNGAVPLGHLGRACEALLGKDPSQQDLENNCKFKYTIVINDAAQDPRMIIDPN